MTNVLQVPQITVLMPVYNGEKYLRESIESILNQSYGDFEFLIIDDASTDKSADAIELFDDPRIRYLKNDINLGLIGTLNRGLHAAAGKYIARMDQDDISLPERFATQLAFLEAHPEIGVLGAAVQMIDGSGDLVDAPLVFPVSPHCVEWAMYFFCPIAHPAVLMHRDLALQVGGYSPQALHAEDYDFWIRLSKVTQLANLSETLLKLRKHETNMTKVFYSQNLTTADKTAQALVAEHLGQPYVESYVLYGDRRNAFKAPVPSARMISSLYFKMLARRSLSKADRKIIRQDAGRRIFGIMRKSPVSLIDKLKIVGLILKVDPFSVFRYGFRKLAK